MKENLKEIEKLILEGNTPAAARQLRRVQGASLTRKQREAVASLARRAGRPELTLRLLNPVVRPRHGLRLQATPSEKAIYAAALIRIGAVEEGREILRGLSPQEFPDSLIFMAHGLMTEWDYEGVIPVLTRYLKLPGLTPYQEIVGKVNLAAALVHEEQHAQAGPLLEELKDSARRQGLLLLLGNTLELCAQRAIDLQDWAGAERHLDLAAQALRECDALDAFFVHKWTVILKIHQQGGGKKGLRLLARLRQEAKRRRHWESLRDCDFLQAILRQEAGWALRLYFGTPFEAFRRRIFRKFPAPLAIPDAYWWDFDAAEPGKKQVDLLALTLDGAGGLSDQPPLLHRLASLLLSDFYRPFRVATLHAGLYPQEVFNPDTSPARVHQAVRALRGLLKGEHLPLQIEQTGGAYRLTCQTACVVRVPRRAPVWEPELKELAGLQGVLPQPSFSAEDVQVRLALSRRSVLRRLAKAVEEGLIERERAGPGSRYTFKEKTK